LQRVNLHGKYNRSYWGDALTIKLMHPSARQFAASKGDQVFRNKMPAPGITVTINAAAAQPDSWVAFSGYIQHQSTKSELSLFKLDTDAGAFFAGSYGGGDAPDEMWLSAPANSRWGDLYKEHPNNEPVTSTLTITSATVKEVTSSKPSIIATKSFKNQSSVPVTYNTSITQEVMNTAETNWSNTKTYEVGQTISYDVSFLGSGSSGETSFTFTQEFAKGGSSTESVMLGDSTGVEVVLQPEQAVKVLLSTSTGSMNIELVYQLTIAGTPFGTFDSPYTWPNNPQYGSHYIWGQYVSSMLEYGSVPQFVTIKETLSLGFFTNTSVVVIDESTGKELKRYDVRKPIIGIPGTLPS